MFGAERRSSILLVHLEIAPTNRWLTRLRSSVHCASRDIGLSSVSSSSKPRSYFWLDLRVGHLHGKTFQKTTRRKAVQRGDARTYSWPWQSLSHSWWAILLPL